jgi:rhodanese-related sulfurtransferase
MRGGPFHLSACPAYSSNRTNRQERKVAEMTEFPMIGYREFDLWMESGKIGQLVDLREPELFAKSRIWGSVNLPYEELEENLDSIRRDSPVVFYCDRGAKSMVVCRDLWQLGYEAVDLAGGMLNYRGKYIDRSPLSALK